MASTTALSPFELLPYVVLDIICDYLDNESDHRPDLCAFSLTSRRCCAAANTRRFNQIVLIVPNLDDLETILGDLKAVLGHGERYGLVHRLKVKGVPRGPGPWDRNMPEKGDDEKYAEDDDNARSIERNFDGPPFCRLENDQYRVIQGGSHDRNADWLPLVAFIRELPSLKDLVWDPAVTTCLLDALRELHDVERRPWCRLHVPGFFIRGMVYDRDSPKPISLETYALVTSPALYSIEGTFSTFNHEGDLDYSPDVLYLMMQGLAPNLTNVWFKWKRYGVSLAQDQSIARGRPAWRGFFLIGQTDEEKKVIEAGRGTGSLKNMRLDFRLGPQVFNAQSMANLRRLHLKWYRDTCLILADLVIAGHVPHLEMLSLVEISSHTEPDQAAVNQIVSHANPLRHLVLKGHFTMTTFDLATRQHGSTLINLCLDPYPAYMYDPRNKEEDAEHPLFAFSPHTVQIIAERCPRLEEVHVEMQRTRGDSREVAMYRALGTLRRLKRLVIELICTVCPEEDEDEEGADEDQSRIEMLKQGISNHATDEALARAIFDIVSPPDHGQGRLQYLRIEPRIDTGSLSLDVSFYSATSVLGRHWVCQTDNKEEGRDRVIVREVEAHNARQAIKECLREDWGNKWLDKTENFQAMFNSLWPGDGPPWERWTSLPLETGEETGQQ